MAIQLPDLQAQITLDTSQLSRAVGDAESDLDRLDGGGDIPITADASQALGEIADVRSELGALPSPDVAVAVTADTEQAAREVDGFVDEFVEGVREGSNQARDELGRFTKAAGDAGGKAGKDAGGNMGQGIIDNLKALPIAGTFVGLGVVAATAFVSSFDNESRADLLEARTGLDQATAARIGNAAGEAYANNFGESIAGNLDTARIAIQGGLIDPAATQRDTQQVIEQLQGVVDVLGGDVQEVAFATGQAINAGLVDTSTEAFDLIVRGYQLGADAGGDFVDTISGSAATFTQFGLDGAEAVGLMVQGFDKGAPSAEFFVGALEELAGNAGDSADIFETLGLNGEEMGARLTGGGAAAREGLVLLLDALRAVEDPAARTVALTQLFGEEATAMQEALLALDPTTAVATLGAVEDAASGAISTLGDNAAGALASAQRNMEVAADGIKGAVAAAFSDDLKDFGTYVQENREGVVRFVLDLANGALTMGEAFVNGGASALETMGSLAGAVSDTILPVAALVEAIDVIPGIDLGGTVDALKEAALAGYEIEEGANAGADALRTNLIDNGIDPARQKLNELGDGLIVEAALHDASVRLANDVANIGVAANGSALALDTSSAAFDRTSAAGQALDEQLRAATASLEGNLQAAANAGAGTDSLTETFNENRGALVAQLEAMGFSTEAANQLADQYGAVPGLVETTFAQPGMPGAQRSTATYQGALRQLPTTKSTSVTLAGADNAIRNAQRLRDAILGIPLSRTSTVRYNSIIEAGGQVPGRAGGGPVWPGLGLTLVGEEGPELVAWGGPGQVIPAGITQQLMSGARTVGPEDGMAVAGGGSTAVSVRVFIGDTELRGMVRAEVSDGLADEAQAMRVGRV